MSIGSPSSSQRPNPAVAAPPNAGQLSGSGSSINGDDEAKFAGADRNDTLFDRWLETELQAEFGAVAAEPIPDGLLKIIENHRGRRG